MVQQIKDTLWLIVVAALVAVLVNDVFRAAAVVAVTESDPAHYGSATECD